MGTALQTMRTAIWAPNGQPAYPSDGWTARQATWSGLRPVEPARILLCHGADASAAPSFLHGVTAFEAFCHNLDAPGENLEFCHGLLDASATVNRPAGKPSWALHGVVRKGWRKVLGCFEPRHNAILNHMWCDELCEDDEKAREPRYTPTQLAASNGDLTAVKTLLHLW